MKSGGRQDDFFFFSDGWLCWGLVWGLVCGASAVASKEGEQGKEGQGWGGNERLCTKEKERDKDKKRNKEWMNGWMDGRRKRRRS